MFDYPAMLRARSMNAHLRNSASSGGRSASGRQQTVFSDAGFWEVEISGIVVNSRETAWAYDAMIARLRTGETMVVTLCTPYRAPVDPSKPVTVVEAASLRATALNVEGLSADLTAGQRFSIGNRLYQLTQIDSEVALNAGIVTSISGPDVWDDGEVWRDEMSWASQLKILPPLRGTANVGAICIFRTLKVIVGLKDMADGDLSLDLGRFGKPSLTLIETI